MCDQVWVTWDDLIYDTDVLNLGPRMDGQTLQQVLIGVFVSLWDLVDV